MNGLTSKARATFERACADGKMPKQSSFSCEELFDYCAAQNAWQDTLDPSDPRHERMFEIMREGGEAWVRIWWGGYEYDWDLDRFEHPGDVLQMLEHICKKTWRFTTGKRISKLISAVYHAKGWALYDAPTVHANQAPPAWSGAKAEREKMTAPLRYSVLKRDGFRCRACGSSVSTGAVLHVDHIQAVSKGGSTVYENLQTLCSACNQGKGAR